MCISQSGISPYWSVTILKHLTHYSMVWFGNHSHQILRAHYIKYRRLMHGDIARFVTENEPVYTRILYLCPRVDNCAIAWSKTASRACRFSLVAMTHQGAAVVSVRASISAAAWT